MNRPLEEEVVAALLNSRKYRHCCEDVLLRVASRAAQTHRHPQAAIKAAKRKLHQVCGPFLDGVDFRAMDSELTRMSITKDLRDCCHRILQSHPSTAERLPTLESFYARIFEGVSSPITLLDLGCGLNAFALPWMPHQKIANYEAVDLDNRITDRLNRFFNIVGLRGTATTQDIFSFSGTQRFDLALILKVLPGLEQQCSGAGYEQISRLHANRIIISFPLRTVGGKSVGMRTSYANYMDKLVNRLGTPYICWTMGNEAVYELRNTV